MWPTRALKLIASPLCDIIRGVKNQTTIVFNATQPSSVPASLDFLSVSDYWEARTENGDAPPSVERMMRYLKPHRETLRHVAAAYGKPLVFGEFGCGVRRFQARSPSGCTLANPPDEDEQAAYCEAFLRAFMDEPWCRFDMQTVKS